MEHLTLGRLVEELEKHDPDKILYLGFDDPHSYRGYYERVSFEPAKNITIGEVLKEVKKAIGRGFHGWKGGSYWMDENTLVYIADEGCSSEENAELTLDRLNFLLWINDSYNIKSEI